MNLLEAFVKLDEDAFDTTPKGIEDLSNFMDDADVVDDEIEIIDPDIDFGDDDTMPADDEESEEENAHVGQLVLQCNTCNALVYKDKDEVELDEEGNVEEEECPNCHNVSKFDVIGKICTVDDLEDELEDDEEESEEKEEDESEKPEEESEEEVEVDDEEEKSIKEESLRRPNKNKRLVEAPAGDFSYFKSNGNDEMSYNRDALRYAKSLLKRHYLDKVHTSSMDDFSRNIAILNDAVKFVEEEFNQDIKPSGSIPRYKDLNQEGPVNTICNGYLDLCDDIEKSFNDCYYIGFDRCRDGDDKYTQTPPGLDYTATFSIFDESCIFKIRTTPEGIEEYTRFINLPDSVNCKNTYKLAENIVSLIPELKHQFFTFSERKLDEISIRLNQGLDRSLFTFIPLDELREKIKGAMVLKESLRSPRKKSLKEKLVEAPQEVVDELLQILENHGFILDDSIKHENPIRTWMGAIHIQVINPDSFIDEDGDIGYQLKKYVTEELINEIQALEDRSDCPITWNFGPNADNQVTGGLDVDKQWIEDGINESVRRPKKKSLKEDVSQLDFDVDPNENVFYIFPKLTAEDIRIARGYSLYPEEGLGPYDDSTVLSGRFEDLVDFADNYLDYQLVDGYLLDENGDEIWLNESLRKPRRKSVKESLRRPNKKSLKENRQKLNEGPGAGYTVSGDLTDIRINSFDFKVNGDEVIVNCDIDADMENAEAYSYYYGGEVGYEVPVKISQVSYYIYDDSQLNDSDVEEELEYDLSHLKFKAYVGGGWSHSTFDGNLEVKDIRHWNGEDSDIFNVIMHCTDEEDIQFIDDLVTGNSEYSEKNEEEFDESLRRPRKIRESQDKLDAIYDMLDNTELEYNFVEEYRNGWYIVDICQQDNEGIGEALDILESAGIDCREDDGTILIYPDIDDLDESCKTKKSSPKDKILKDVKKLKKESLTESKENVADTFKNYSAYASNFKPLRIVKNGKDYYVYREDDPDKNHYIQYGNKDYIDGWLYGAVQAKQKIVENKKLKKDSLKESSDTPSKETIKDCIEDYRENAFGFDGIKDYVNTQFPKHSSDFKKALIKAMRKQCESLTEDLEGITVDTDEETIQITQKEDGGVAVETSPKESDESFMEEPMFEEPPMEGDEVSGDEEVIEPLTDEEEEEIAEENPESEEGKEDKGDEDEEEIEDIDSDSFDELGESYLKEAYENVKSFKTNKIYKKNGKLVVEGIVSFKSGKNKKTSFIFESAHNKSKKKVLLGENKQITPNSKSFRLRGVVKNKKMVCESLRYNYKEGKNRVSGVCRVK